jgi:hypothetical protein
MNAGFAAGAALSKLAKAGKTYSDSMEKSMGKNDDASVSKQGGNSSDTGRKVGTIARKIGTKIGSKIGGKKPSKGTMLKSLSSKGM